MIDPNKPRYLALAACFLMARYLDDKYWESDLLSDDNYAVIIQCTAATNHPLTYATLDDI